MYANEETMKKLAEKDEEVQLAFEVYEEENNLQPLLTEQDILEHYSEEFMRFLDRSEEERNPFDLTKRYRYRRLRFYDSHIAFLLRHPISNESKPVTVLEFIQPDIETSAKIAQIQDQKAGGAISGVDAMYQMFTTLTGIHKTSLRRLKQVDANILLELMHAFFGSSPDESSSSK